MKNILKKIIDWFKPKHRIIIKNVDKSSSITIIIDKKKLEKLDDKGL